MSDKRLDSFKTRRTLKVGNKSYDYFSLKEAQKAGVRGIPVIRLEDGTMMRESRDIINMLKGKFNV